MQPPPISAQTLIETLDLPLLVLDGEGSVTWANAAAAALGIAPEVFEKSDIHVHVPAGATPKDGPSAGVAMYTALASLLTGRPVRYDVAMTGEITLRGLVTPIGGVKEKVLAAHRAGIKIVFLPERNQKDTIDIPDEVKSQLDIRFMTKIDDALAVALGDAPTTPEPEPAIPPPTAPSRGNVGERLPS